MKTSFSILIVTLVFVCKLLADPGAPIALIKASAFKGAGTASTGTATLIAKNRYAYWLSADHVTGTAPYVIVTDHRGNSWKLQRISRSSKADLSLFRGNPKNTPEPIKIWTANTTSDRWCYAEGYAGGTLRGFGRRKGKERNTYIGRFTITLPSIPGDSGGCLYTVYNGHRYQVSVTSTSDFRTHTNGATPKDLRTFLTAAGLQVNRRGEVTPLKETLGGRNWPDPLRRRSPDP